MSQNGTVLKVCVDRGVGVYSGMEGPSTYIRTLRTDFAPS